MADTVLDTALRSLTDAQLEEEISEVAADLVLAERYPHNADKVPLIRAWWGRLKGEQERVPVKLPVSVSQVYHALYGEPQRWAAKGDGTYGYVHNPAGYDRRKLEQAERVAWRNLVLWIDAALSAASVGLQTITEAFFAHAIVGATGERMIDVVHEYQHQLGVGVQRLLTSEAES